MFPLAIAVVEIECKESWSWFMRHLLAAIDYVNKPDVTFISDRQKGLIETFQQVLPGADHRFCVRHMYANFKRAGFTGKTLKDLLWAAASSYTIAEFEVHMEKIKAEEQEAWEWLKELHPSHWSRAYFNTRCKTDLLVNNISESFNSYILEARDKPIYTMLEMIRRQVMVRFQAKKKFMSKCEGKLCPNIRKKLEKIKVDSRFCFAEYSGEQMYEVDCHEKIFVVDLSRQTCTCRRWEMTGLPCIHAVASIFCHQLNPEDFVHPWYWRETYMSTYAPMIYPIPDPTQWPDRDDEDLLPPMYRKQSGRPKKARNKVNDDSKNNIHVSRSKPMKCSNCQGYGHNRTSCTIQAVQARRNYPTRGGRGGRPRGGSSGVTGISTGQTGGRTGARGRGRGGRAGARGRAGVRGRAGLSNTSGGNAVGWVPQSQPWDGGRARGRRGRGRGRARGRSVGNGDARGMNALSQTSQVSYFEFGGPSSQGGANTQ